MTTAMRIQIAAATILCAGAAWAGGYAVPNTNARDLSMTGSVVAGQRDATAVYVNPAALAGLDGLSVVLNGTLIDFRSSWTAPDGSASTDTLLKGAYPPSVFASYGGNASGIGWGVGAGFNIPFGGNVYWPSDWPGRYDIQIVNRRTYGAYLTGGIQPIPQVKFGGGLIYYRTTEDLGQAVNFLSQEGSAELGAAGGKLSYDVSAEFTPINGIPFTIGVDYKHKADQNLTGTAHFSNVPAALGPNALDQTVTHALTVPNTLNVGVAYRVLPELLLTGAWTLDRWVVYREDLFLGSAGTTIVVNRDYTNGYTFRIGAELEDLVPRFTFRAGVLRDSSPTRPRALTPSIPDSDVTGVALGVGFAVLPNLRLNATWFHAFYDASSTVGNAVLTPGTFDPLANIVTVGIAWQPGGPSSGISAALARKP